MDPIIVELPNGQKAEFPAGTPPEVIERVKAQYGGPAKPPALPQSSPKVGAPPGGPGSLADSFLARAARGALINRVDPGAEILARISDATGATPYVNRVSDALGLPKSDAKTVQGLNAGRVAEQAASRARAGSEGFDWAALTGTAAADMATLGGIFRAAGRPEFVKPQNLADVSKAGAAAGAIVGPAGPVEKSERMSGPELAWAKAKQAALGGAFGAVAAPLVSVGIDKLVSAGQGLGQGIRDTVRRTVAPSEGQRTAGDSKALEAYLRKTCDTEYHPVGTCRMGPDSDPMAVVDAQLRAPNADRLTRITRQIRGHWLRNPGWTNSYYDDMAWLALALQRAGGYLGVDTAPIEQLIAANLTVPQIREHIGADSLGYLSIAGLMEAIGLPEEMFCNACFHGRYPLPIETEQGKFVLERP